MIRKLIFAAIALYVLPLPFTLAQSERAERLGLLKKHVEEISAVAGHPGVIKAFSEVERLEPETLRDLILLTEIPASPFKEEARARKMASMLLEAGVDSVWTDEAGNVIALRKGVSGSKRVMVDAHLDTVFPEGTDVTVKFSGDTLKAPGVGDNTRGLAAMLAAIKAMNRAGIRTSADILFTGTVGEEGLGDLKGVKHLFREGAARIDSHIALDGTGIGGIVNSAVGSIRYRTVFKGPGGHSYGAFGLANPHNALARAIAGFVAEADTLTRSGIKTTYNIGVIGGGTSVNAIPFESWFEVDMRSESPERLKRLDAIFRRAVETALAEENRMKRMGEDLTADMIRVGDRPSGSLRGNSPLVQRAAASAAHLGAVPMLGASSTNSNIPLSLGIPSITIGAGGKAGGAHSLEEWWINDHGTLGIRHLLLVLLAEAGISD